MWPEFLHHITLHFPIVLTLVLAATATFAPHEDNQDVLQLLRYGGLFTLGVTVITAASGLVAAGFSGGDSTLEHHRYLGILATLTIALAALSVEIGCRTENKDLRSFGLLTWWAAALATVGAAHWGSWAEHPEIIPFLGH